MLFSHCFTAHFNLESYTQSHTNRLPFHIDHTTNTNINSSPYVLFFFQSKNTFESQFVNSNSSVAGIAGSLATYYLLYDNVNLINEQIDIYRSITREEIQSVAQKYLSPNQRVEIEYLPGEEVGEE